uniref:BTB domain-containing protein n=1 Tax=Panagrolaimus sp. ES5 TaxID=591445 RepID=A0AC34FKA5_9BILA
MEQKNLYDIQMERFKIFKTQNPAEFDVVFEIDGKKLYADKFKLRTISKTFDAMFLKRQNALPRRNYYKTTTPTKVDEAFKIQNFNFDDFNKFITFIYSGECQFTFCNIAALITISEVYQVQIFKNACEQFLLNYTWNFNNVYHIFELAYKHSMVYLKNSLLGFVSKNVLTFIGSLNFLNLQKAIVYDVVESNEDTLRQEELFEK